MKRTFGYSLIAALAALAIVAVWHTPRAHAFNPQPDPPAFGMLGIAPYETVRVNAACADGPLPGGVPPGPCRVTLAFRDASGQILKQATVGLNPGAGTFLDLTTAEAGVSGRRVEVQPFISPAGMGFVLASVEVFDDFTGRTVVALNTTEPKSLGSSPVVGQ